MKENEFMLILQELNFIKYALNIRNLRLDSLLDFHWSFVFKTLAIDRYCVGVQHHNTESSDILGATFKN